jgi:hypothetical protein
MRLALRSAGAASASAVAAAVVLASTPAAYAAGTGGVDLRPLDTNATAFHLSLRAGHHRLERFELHNLTGSPASVRVYAATAAKTSEGTFTVGGAGSAPWAAVADRTVTLAPHAKQTVSFDVSRDLAPVGQGMTYGAVVLEQAHGTVIARVATLIYLNRVGPSKVLASPPPSVRPRPVEPVKGTAPVLSLGHAVERPLAVLALAVALVGFVGALIPFAVRRRRRREAALAA